jgi:hypothetical protein
MKSENHLLKTQLTKDSGIDSDHHQYHQHHQLVHQSSLKFSPCKQSKQINLSNRLEVGGEDDKKAAEPGNFLNSTVKAG